MTKPTTLRERLALNLLTLAAKVLPAGHRSVVAIDLAGKTLTSGGSFIFVDAHKMGSARLNNKLLAAFPPGEDIRPVKGDEAQLTHKQQRDDRRSIANAIQRLEKRFQLRVLSDGRHLQWQHDRLGEVNYWPTTGRWWVPKTEKRGMGLDMLGGVLGVKL